MTATESPLRSVYANHECDAARLIYADWLDEDGNEAVDPGRAEFIRHQCGPKRCASFGRCNAGHCREKILLAANGPRWIACPCLECKGNSRKMCPDCIHWKGPIPANCRCNGLRKIGCPVCGGTGDLMQVMNLEGPGGYSAPQPRDHAFRRGFLASVTVPTLADIGGTWMGSTFQATPWLRAVVRAVPTLEMVNPADREPYHNGKGYCWMNSGRINPSMSVCPKAELPEVLFAAVACGRTKSARWVHFDTVADAVEALARAVCQFGRS